MRSTRPVRHRRRVKAAMPPLSPLDQALYWVMMTLTLGIMLFFPLSGAFLREQIAFGDPNVIAVAGGNGVYFAFVPVFFVGLPLTGVTVVAYRNKRPLFGNPATQYGPPEYEVIYPLFTKDKTMKVVCRELLSSLAARRAETLLLLILMVIGLLVFPLSFYGRNQLCADGSVVRYNVLNQVTAEYAPSAVVELRLSIDQDRTSSSRDYPLLLPDEYDYNAFLTLQLADGQACTFNILSFFDNGRRDWLSSLQTVLNLCSRFPKESIATANADLLEPMALDKGLNQQEAELLREIFSIYR